jgi:hypothetical protein
MSGHLCPVSTKHHAGTEVDAMVSMGWRVWRVGRVAEGRAEVVVCRQLCSVSVKHHARMEVDEMVSVGWRVWRVWRVVDASAICQLYT